MNVQVWLEQLKKLDELINAKLAERQRLIDIATDISSRAPDGIPPTNTGIVSQKMQDAVISLIDLEKQINKLIDDYVNYKNKVIKTLEKLPSKEYGVLHRYYVRGMTIRKIAEDMNYSERQILRIKEKALMNLEVVLVCHPAPVI